jgi:hypothetical protein
VSKGQENRPKSGTRNGASLGALAQGNVCRNGDGTVFRLALKCKEVKQSDKTSVVNRPRAGEHITSYKDDGNFSSSILLLSSPGGGSALLGFMVLDELVEVLSIKRNAAFANPHDGQGTIPGQLPDGPRGLEAEIDPRLLRCEQTGREGGCGTQSPGLHGPESRSVPNE